MGQPAGGNLIQVLKWRTSYPYPRYFSVIAIYGRYSLCVFQQK